MDERLMSELGEEGIGGALGAESRDAHVPWVEGRLIGIAVDEAPDALQQGPPVPPGEVGAPRRALEQNVAAEQRRLTRDRVGQMSGAVARGEEDLDLKPGEREALAAGEGLVCLVALVGAEARPGDVGH